MQRANKKKSIPAGETKHSVQTAEYKRFYEIWEKNADKLAKVHRDMSAARTAQDHYLYDELNKERERIGQIMSDNAHNRYLRISRFLPRSE